MFDVKPLNLVTIQRKIVELNDLKLKNILMGRKVRNNRLDKEIMFYKNKCKNIIKNTNLFNK